MQPAHANHEIDALQEQARRIRIRMLTMVARAEAGHLGGSLSAADLLTALYFRCMRIDPANPTWEDRDRFILSKGHATPLYYSVLSARGFFPDSLLDTYDQVGSLLQGHPDMSKTPGVDMSTGSLGQGMSAAVGMCIGRDLAGKRFHVFVLTGDGEMQEGQVWEAAMYAGTHGIGNLVCIVDCNGMQLSSRTEQGLSPTPLAEKWRAFGWQAMEIEGNTMSQVAKGLDKAREPGSRPLVIIAHTVKGKGVSFMEDEVSWHSRIPSHGEMALALRELGAPEEEVRAWRE
jgi:transketolase